MVSGSVKNEYMPDYVSPPGETLSEVLEDAGMSQAELARRTGRPNKTINEIIQGKAGITPETALQLERVFGIPARFWIAREQHYREALARQDENKQLAEQTKWLEQIPVSDMIHKGWIDSYNDEIQLLKAVLGFFGISSPDQWKSIWEYKPAFRQSLFAYADPVAVSVWLRKGQLESERIDCAKYDAGRFRENLQQIRALTVQPPAVFEPELRRLCSEAGVAVVFVPQLPNSRVSGATYWLNSDKALIQLSLRYKTNDHLWFTFFHEAGHIVLHGKRDVFLEDENRKSVEEKEASEYAANLLIPPADWDRFVRSVPAGRISKKAISDFAKEIGIAPGIVVGRLQHEKLIPYSHCNDLKVRLEWK